MGRTVRRSQEPGGRGERQKGTAMKQSSGRKAGSSRHWAQSKLRHTLASSGSRAGHLEETAKALQVFRGTKRLELQGRC